jgi:hypothetical protein
MRHCKYLSPLAPVVCHGGAAAGLRSVGSAQFFSGKVRESIEDARMACRQALSHFRLCGAGPVRQPAWAGELMAQYW